MQRHFTSARRLYKAMDSWMDASTVILTTPKLKKDKCKNKNEIDFDIMMLKRSAKSTFYANAYVFPGGRIDKADCSSEWMSLYDSVDESFVNHFQKLRINQSEKHRSPMFLSNINDTLLREVSYRICAIRETFEETGVLLTRMKTDGLEKGVKFADCYQFNSIKEVNEWRQRVHADANQFIKLCKHLRCVPDVWALHEWCNWLTPSEMLGKFSKRYDTVFYKAALKTVPKHFEQDDKEITHIILDSADEILSAYRSTKITCGPPQVYELSRLLRFHSHNELAKFSCERGMLGMERWLPVLCHTEDGCRMSLYPGDCHYPHEAVEKGDSSPITIPITYEQMVEKFPDRLNHMKINLQSSGLIFDVVSTSPSRYGHVTPVSSCDWSDKLPQNKL